MMGEWRLNTTIPPVYNGWNEVLLDVLKMSEDSTEGS